MAEILVETFEQTETLANGEEEGTEEALKLIETLGLKGQAKLITPGKERVPYRQMNIKEKRVYETLFPEKTKIEEYEMGFIPLRVLQIAAHAKGLGVYRGIVIWSERVKPTDPLLVGEIDSSTYHILARWGEALESFQVLWDRAVKMKMSEFSVGARKRISEIQLIEANPEAMAIEHLNGGWVHI